MLRCVDVPRQGGCLSLKLLKKLEPAEVSTSQNSIAYSLPAVLGFTADGQDGGEVNEAGLGGAQEPWWGKWRGSFSSSLFRQVIAGGNPMRAVK
jgi:hypothetical protein